MPTSSTSGAARSIWGISVLGSGSKAAFKAKFGLPFTLIADEQHAVAERYGVWVDKVNYGRTYKGIARVTFLIDPAGSIARVWPQGQGRRARRGGARGHRRALPRRMTPVVAAEPGEVRHRSWGETSDASARKLSDVRAYHRESVQALS